MHPLVKDYLEIFDFDSDILPSDHYPKTPLVVAFLNLKLALFKKMDVSKAFASAEKAFQEKEDNIELVIIFLEIWFRVSYFNSRNQEADSILKRIKKIPKENLPLEFSIIERICDGIIHGINKNIVKYVETMLEATEILPKNSVVYQRVFLKLCMIEASRGKLNKYLEKIKEIKKDNKNESLQIKIKIIEFINSIEQSNHLKAESLLLELEQNEIFTKVLSQSRAYFKQSLSIAHHYFEGKVSPSTKNNLLKDKPAWIQSTYYLLLREPALALEYAKKDIDLITAMRQMGFCSYVHIRAELSSRNFEAARWLLQQKENEGNSASIENFFLARIEILAGNLDRAKNYLRKLKAFVIKYGFEKRMELELDLACELNINQYNRLLKSCDQVESSRIPMPVKISKNISPPSLIIGSSMAMTNLRSQIEKLAPLNISILITGETGTGKDLVARALHEASPRRKEIYTAINCAAISENLLQSELFGYEKGAFTGAFSSHKGIIEEAENGTVFLDEIGDISPQLQIALLRLLENGEYRPVGSNKAKKMSCRVIAATNVPLEKQIENKNFRKDLFYRLERFLIYIPPLRERKEDIRDLAFYFLQRDRNTQEKLTISTELIKALELNSWPGNIRELRNVMERMRILNSGKLQFTISDLDKEYVPKIKNELVEDRSGFFPTVNLDAIPNHSITSNDDKLLEISGKKDLDNSSLFTTTGYNQKRIEILKRMFQKYERLSKTEAAKAINISISSITNDLNKLVIDGYIEKVEPTPSPRTHYYQIKNQKN